MDGEWFSPELGHRGHHVLNLIDKMAEVNMTEEVESYGTLEFLWRRMQGTPMMKPCFSWLTVKTLLPTLRIAKKDTALCGWRQLGDGIGQETKCDRGHMHSHCLSGILARGP